MKSIRIVAGVVLAGLLVFYTWFAFREDGRLRTVPGVPPAVWFYFDHHANVRNGVGFLILGAVGAAVVTGLGPRWQVISLGLLVGSPVIKDFAQDLFAPSRHFNWDATALGMVGALVGWGAAALLLRMINVK